MPGGTGTFFFTGTPSESTAATITGQTGLLPTSHIEAWFQHGDSASGNGADEHEEAAALCPLTCKYNGTDQFTVTASPIAALGVGFFTFHYFWSN